MLLHLPTEGQLKNRKVSLRKKHTSEPAEFWCPWGYGWHVQVAFRVGGWTLVDFGTYTTHYDRKQYSKTFGPRMYMFVKTEHQTAYATMFQVAQRFARLVIYIELNVTFGRPDRAQYITSAFMEKSHFSTATRILCENTREKIKLLKVPAFYEDNVLPDIRYLSKARSEKQFKALSNVFLVFWKENSEDDYAAWFRGIYLAACPGITPSQNALEAHHRVIKQVYVGSLRVSPADVLNDSIPRIIGLQEGEPTRQMLNHYAEGRWVSAAVARAQTLAQEKDNYSVIKGTRAKFVKPILFNASKFIVSPKNIHSAVLTVFARQCTYRNSVNGKLAKDLVMNTIELQCLSIHQVQVLSRVPLDTGCMISAAPTILNRTIRFGFLTSKLIRMKLTNFL
ncbi:hypothetical protein GQ600_21034 [Phytophthora cactorum]|nr:hypothetical protein GQ600_21034 [Phytophthora cactorum]